MSAQTIIATPATAHTEILVKKAIEAFYNQEIESVLAGTRFCSIYFTPYGVKYEMVGLTVGRLGQWPRALADTIFLFCKLDGGCVEPH